MKIELNDNGQTEIRELFTTTVLIAPNGERIEVKMKKGGGFERVDMVTSGKGYETEQSQVLKLADLKEAGLFAGNTN